MSDVRGQGRILPFDIGLDEWLAAIWLIANAKNGISSCEIHRALGVTQKTAWFLLHRIRLAMQNGTFETKMGGTIEVDETFIGGLSRNMHKKDRTRKITGMGGTGKAVVMGLLERYGDKRRRLNGEQIRELEIDKGQTSFEQEPTTLEYPSDFDIPLVKESTERFRKSRDLQLTLSDEEVLEYLHLGKIKHRTFYPNNACVIVFAKDPREVFPGCRIRFFRFAGEEEGTGERWNPQKDIWIDIGSIPHQIKEAERILDSQLRTFTRLGSDNKFHTTPEYTKTAWYEALVNACVHRSYSLRNMNIFIKIKFDDRIEIESPGGFPPLVTPENIYTSHNPRNPRVFDAMQ